MAIMGSAYGRSAVGILHNTTLRSRRFLVFFYYLFGSTYPCGCLRALLITIPLHIPPKSYTYYVIEYVCHGLVGMTLNSLTLSPLEKKQSWRSHVQPPVD
jgi:hypothetical protein